MNPNKNNANLHTMVLSEKKPLNVLNFEEKVDTFIRKNEKSSTVFIQHKHGIGSKIKNIDACFNLIEKDFGDVDEVSFTTDRYATKSGDLLIIQWKNTFKNRLSL